MRPGTDAALVSLRSTLTEREAIEAFRRHDSAWMRRVRRSHLRSIARAFVPYYAFHVTMADGRRQETSLFAVDAVHGTLDPFQFEGSVASLALEPINGSNSLTATLGVDAAWPILVDKLRRVVFQGGFWRIGTPRFSADREPLLLHVPYWVGFYADGPRVQLEVLDAVRRCFEGAKARALFQSWLEDAPQSITVASSTSTRASSTLLR